MAQNYKLVKKKNLGKDSETIPQKMFAIPSYNGYTDMETLCKMIGARSTVSSADVKAVLDNLNFVLDMELQAGHIVQLGEFGNFRLSVSSSGAENKEAFSASMLKKARVLFTPGKSLRNTVGTLSLAAKQDEAAPETGGGGGEDDRPGEL